MSSHCNLVAGCVAAAAWHPFLAQLPGPGARVGVGAEPAVLALFSDGPFWAIALLLVAWLLVC